jgi:hypothetical protein
VGECKIQPPRVHPISSTLEKGTAKFKDAMKLLRKRGKGVETLNDELSEEH